MAIDLQIFDKIDELIIHYGGDEGLLQLAGELETSVRTLQRWRNGDHFPNQAKQQRITDLYKKVIQPETI